MAYAEKYFFTWIADRDTRIVGGTPDNFECQILQDGYAGASTEIEAQESPVIILYENVGDNKLQSLRGSKATLNLIATSQFQLEDLYTENEREYLVLVLRNGSVIWRGFIIPDGCKEQFMFTPYGISVNAVDGLGLLKNLSYAQNDGNFFLGKSSFLQVIYQCLDRVQVPDMELNTCVNIYEETMTQGDEYDPLLQAYVNEERYIKDDTFNPMNCEEVLTAILQEWTACIIQSEGKWWIYRPNEAALSGTLVFRRYVDGNISYDGLTVTKDIDILIGGESEGTVLAPYFHINTNQLKMIEKPYKTASMSYHYGLNKGILDNPTLAGAFTEGAGDPIGPRDDIQIPGWMRSGTIYTGLNPGGGVIFYKVSGFNNADYYQNDQHVTISQGQQLQLDISYESIPTLTTTDMIFGIELFDGTDNWYLQPRFLGVYEWAKDGSFTEWTTLRSNFGVSNGQIISAPTPVGGIISIKVYPPDNPSGDIIYFSINATRYLNNDPVVGEIHSVQQVGEYSYVPELIQVFNGDDETDFWYGTIFRPDQDTPTTVWVRRGLSESPLALPFASEKEFLRIAVEEIARLHGAPYVRFEGDVFGYFNPLSRATINLITGKFMPLSLTYDLQRGTTFAVWSRVSNEEIGMQYTLSPDYGDTTKVLVI